MTGQVAKKQLIPQEHLLGERVFLRRLPPDPAVALTIFETVNRERMRLAPWLSWVDGTQTAQNTLEYLQAANACWGNGSMYDYGLFESATAQWIGNIGLHSVDHGNESAEIGYWISSAWEGRGLVADAVRTLERAAFAAGFHRLRIRCRVQNLRSAAVPQRCGWRFEGVHRGDHLESSRTAAHLSTLIFSRVATDPSDLGVSDFLAATGQLVVTRDLLRDLEHHKNLVNLNPSSIQRDVICFEVGGTRVILVDLKFLHGLLDCETQIPLWFVLHPEKTVTRLVASGSQVVARIDFARILGTDKMFLDPGQSQECAQATLLKMGQKLMGLWGVA